MFFGRQRRLLPAELTFDDAPWMSATLRQRPDAGGIKFVHESVANELAEKFGARSLRYLLLPESECWYEPMTGGGAHTWCAQSRGSPGCYGPLTAMDYSNQNALPALIATRSRVVVTLC